MRKSTRIAPITRRRIVTAAIANRIEATPNAAPSIRSESIALAITAAITATAATTSARRTRAGRTSELVNAMRAVVTATATAAVRPPQPSGGSVIMTTNVTRIRRRTRP